MSEEYKKILSTDPEWNDFVLGHLTEEEIRDGHPTTDGLRRIAPIVLEGKVTGRSKVIQAPNIQNGMVATVEYTVDLNMMRGFFPGMTNNNDVNQDSCTDCADASPQNCELPYSLHPSAMASTRAEGRALRKLLKLRKVTTAEEIEVPRQTVKEDGSPTFINYNQYTVLNTLFKRAELNGKKYIDKYTEKYHSKKYNSPAEIPYEVAQELIKHVQKWTQGKSPEELPAAPEDVQGYDSNFLVEWVA